MLTNHYLLISKPISLTNLLYSILISPVSYCTHAKYVDFLEMDVIAGYTPVIASGTFSTMLHSKRIRDHVTKHNSSTDGEKE